MRIDKVLADSGYGSRKEVKKLLKSGAVKINEQIVKDAKIQADPKMDSISVHGETVDYNEFIYIMMNKPPGVISATEDNFQKTVLDLLEKDTVRYELFPVGRLDKDTEGLLLLTNDGKLAHQLLSPKKHVKKTYFAIIEGIVTDEDVRTFSEGVMLKDGYVTKPGELNILSAGLTSDIELTITEGKFHQVKRMFEAAGKRVVYLKRLSMGSLKLDETLKPGEYRMLTESELAVLREGQQEA